MTLRTLSLLTVCLSLGGQLRSVGAAPAEAAAEKTTYDEHVRPILRQHCFACHNQNQAKSGLALDSFARVKAGGSSGEVVYAEDPDSSRLWALVNHDEEPTMPPNQDKLPDAQLVIIRRWIEGGLLENSGSSAAAKKPKMNLAVQPTTGKPEGPVAMPESLSMTPIEYTPRAGAVTALATSPWAPLAAVAGQQQICLYHTDSGELLGVLPFRDGLPYCLRFSRDGALLLAAGGRGGATGWVALYDVKTGNQLTQVGEELDAVLSADLNADHTTIALGDSSRLIRIFATQTGEMLHQVKKHTDWLYAVRYSPDGVLLATGDRTNGLLVWEADTAREYLDLRGHTDGITELAWRSDSNVLASASLDGTVRLWDMNDGKQLKRWNAHGGGVLSIAWGHSGVIATAGRDGLVKSWDANGKLLKQFPKFSEPALRVALTHDDKRVIAGDWSGTVRMWNAEDAQEVALLPANPPTLEMRTTQLQPQIAAAAEQVTTAQAAVAAAGQQVEKLAQELEAARGDEAQKPHVAELEKALNTAQQDQQTQQAAATAAAAALEQLQQQLKRLETAATPAQPPAG